VGGGTAPSGAVAVRLDRPGAAVPLTQSVPELGSWARQFAGPSSLAPATDIDPALIPLIAEAARSSRGALMVTDADLEHPGPRVLWVNAAFEALTGYRGDQIIGRSPGVLQGTGTDRGVLRDLRTLLEAGHDFEGEAVNYRADGTAFVMSWRITAVRDHAGRTTNYVATQEDVTRERLRHSPDRDAILALQQALLPPPASRVGFYDIGSATRSAGGHLIGGDWVDVLADPDLPTARVVVGDVTGHGATAVAAMGQLRWAAQAGAMAGLDLVDTMTMLRKLGRSQDTMATLTMIDLHPDGGFTFLNAGHPPAMIVATDGAVRDLGTTCPLLGIQGGDNRSGSDRLEAGEVLVAYTDGVIERRGQNIDGGLAALRGFLSDRVEHRDEPERMASSIIEHFVDLNPGEDDAAVLVLQRMR
jgi:PAS domain S-box-containing protein